MTRRLLYRISKLGVCWTMAGIFSSLPFPSPLPFPLPPISLAHSPMHPILLYLVPRLLPYGTTPRIPPKVPPFFLPSSLPLKGGPRV
jgi:hypothetical protein